VTSTAILINAYCVAPTTGVRLAGGRRALRRRPRAWRRRSPCVAPVAAPTATGDSPPRERRRQDFGGTQGPGGCGGG